MIKQNASFGPAKSANDQLAIGFKVCFQEEGRHTGLKPMKIRGWV